MTHTINEITEWLTRLRAEGPRIADAGAVAGETRAKEQGFIADANGPSVRVRFRGRRTMNQVPQAMREGMEREFERRAR